jgi:hypothetical protein
MKTFFKVFASQVSADFLTAFFPPISSHLSYKQQSRKLVKENILKTTVEKNLGGITY